jgi:hypothetical protein
MNSISEDRALSAAMPMSRSAAELEAKLDALAAMDTDGLRREWRRLYRSNPPRRLKRDLMALAIAWKLQEQVYGGLSAALRRRIGKLGKELEAEGGGQNTAIRLKPGAKLVREWGGETHTVLVTDEGFEWRGQACRSLSMIAREITGTRWSGPRFFGLAKRPKPFTQADEVGHA